MSAFPIPRLFSPLFDLALCAGGCGDLAYYRDGVLSRCCACRRAQAAGAAMSLFLLFVWLEARQQQFPGKGRVRRARALAELVRSGRLTVGCP